MRSERGAATHTGRSAPTTCQARPWCAAGTAQNVSRSASTSTRSTASGRSPLAGLRALDDQRVDLDLQRLDRLPHPVRRLAVGQHVGVQPQGGERCAQPVGQVRRALAFRLDERHDPLGHHVERRTRLGELRRARRPYPHGQVMRPQPPGGPRQPARRGHDLRAEPVGERDRRGDQRRGQAGQGQPRLRDAAAQLGRRHVRPRRRRYARRRARSAAGTPFRRRSRRSATARSPRPARRRPPARGWRRSAAGPAGAGRAGRRRPRRARDRPGQHRRLVGDRERGDHRRRPAAARRTAPGRVRSGGRATPAARGTRWPPSR